MLNARHIQRSAIICGLVCTLLASAMSGTAAARPTHATGWPRHSHRSATTPPTPSRERPTPPRPPRGRRSATTRPTASRRRSSSRSRRPRRRHRGRRSRWPSPPRSPSPPQAAPHSAACASAAARPKSPASPTTTVPASPHEAGTRVLPYTALAQASCRGTTTNSRCRTARPSTLRPRHSRSTPNVPGTEAPSATPARKA